MKNKLRAIWKILTSRAYVVLVSQNKGDLASFHNVDLPSTRIMFAFADNMRTRRELELEAKQIEAQIDKQIEEILG